MFNHEQVIYTIGLSDEHHKAIQKLTPKYVIVKHFTNLQDTNITEADYIIAKVSQSELKILLNDIKNIENLMLCIDKDEFHSLKTHDIGDILPPSPSIDDIKYYYKKLAKKIKLENNLFEQIEILNTIINATDDLVWVKDTKGAHKMFNDSFLNALPSAKDGHRKTRQECLERGHLFIWELSKKDYAEGEFICMESELDVMKADATLTLDEILKVGSGELRNLVTRKSPIHDRHGKIMGTIGVAKDVTQELRYKQQLQKLAYTDMLTGLYNRHYIYEFLEKNQDKKFLVLFMDLNNFKSINDKFGHLKGDEALVITATTLKVVLPDFTLGRLGGDEFIAISEKHGKVSSLIELIKSKLKTAYLIDDDLRDLSISIGHALHDPKDSNIEELIHKADTNMYKSKVKDKAQGS
ncbi:sensor domain-containing diguanylate cyclase [Campylobacter mucosalis]|uniref:sensor domain-containing diguanylate cyclase n=1 Tax=Campylobacter mucosalis TaxID=202 RepID=UPI0014705978|nr:sensor domain-containing diguanylate cyclase [Campylobacter mucosalis]